MGKVVHEEGLSLLAFHDAETVLTIFNDLKGRFRRIEIDVRFRDTHAYGGNCFVFVCKIDKIVRKSFN